MFRKILFWTHLSCGVIAGLVVLMMSVTGVMLTYEHQMLDWANRDYRAQENSGSRASLEQIIAAVEEAYPGTAVSNLTVPADPRDPITVSRGREAALYVNPYSREVLGEGATGVANFFRVTTAWHRWFNASGDNFATARAITGASNLIFLFLIISGLYLWLPRIMKWPMFRGVLFFSGKALKNSKARDYNWHHVLGIWSAIPLIVVVATATVFYYPWANALVYRVVGEEPPTRGSAPASAAQQQPAVAAAAAKPLQALFEQATTQLDNWQSISVQVPSNAADSVRFTIDQGTGREPQKRHSLTLAADGRVQEWAPFSSRSAGSRLRSWVRFLHTGEALGWIGQTVAGLVSLTSIIMVWTGLALSYRRLIQPLFRKR